MMKDMGEMFPILLCLIVSAFFLGNTIFVRFFRRLLVPLAVIIVTVRTINHITGVDTSESPALTNCFVIVTTAVNHILGKLRFRSLEFFIGDVIGVLILFGALNLFNDFTAIRFESLKKKIIDEVYGIARRVPAVKSMLAKEQTKMEEGFEKDLKVKSRAIGVKYGADGPTSHSTIPEKVHNRRNARFHCSVNHRRQEASRCQATVGSFVEYLFTVSKALKALCHANDAIRYLPRS